MTTPLIKLQQMFATQLLADSIDHAFLETINSHSRDEASARLDVYRNNVLSSLTQALGDTYPVIKRLIGDDCFKGVAIDFVRDDPPTQASLHFYGEDFPAFIKNHHSCAHLEYLSDVAQLEWCYQRAFHASDADIISLIDLQTIDSERLGDMCLKVHPSVQLLFSKWPIDVMWSENLQAQPNIIDLSNHNESALLVYREEWQVNVINLNKQTFSFLQNMSNGYSIEQAWLMTDQVIDELGSQLSYLLTLPIFSSYQLK